MSKPKTSEESKPLVTKEPVRGRLPRTDPDWTKKCFVCDQTPIVPLTGMCGPCTWGDASTADGNW